MSNTNDRLPFACQQCNAALEYIESVEYRVTTRAGDLTGQIHVAHLPYPLNPATGKRVSYYSADGTVSDAAPIGLRPLLEEIVRDKAEPNMINVCVKCRVCGTDHSDRLDGISEYTARDRADALG